MEQETVNILIPAIVGLITGALGALVTPLVQWGIEKKRLRFNNRKQTIDEVRAFVVSKQFGVAQFVRSGEYQKLNHMYSKKLNDLIILPSTPDQDVALKRETVRNAILEELNKIEKTWGLL